jgi:polysaccharide deacetylase family sporulation protein PdaB
MKEVLAAMRLACLYFCVLTIVAVVAADNIDPDLRADARIICRVPTTHKVIALTIDDGPNRKTTPEVLAVLKEKNVRVTFFVLGENVDNQPGILAREIADGHEFAVHSYHHNRMTKLDNSNINEELTRTEAAIARMTSEKPTLFRPPGGRYNENVLAIAKERGYLTVLWDVDSHDWARPPVNTLVNSVIKRVSPGSIVLLHDGMYPLPTPKALAILIDRLRDQGYEFVTVSELLDRYELRPAPRAGL